MGPETVFGRVLSILLAMALFRLIALLGSPAVWLVLAFLITWSATLWIVAWRLAYAPQLLADWRQVERAAGGLRAATLGAENLCLACLGLLLVTYDGRWLVGMAATLAGRQAMARVYVWRGSR